jgi:hypothetical protein
MLNVDLAKEIEEFGIEDSFDEPNRGQLMLSQWLRSSKRMD